MEQTQPYDSYKDTMDHINRVRHYLNEAAKELIDRGMKHDASKLQEPEKSGFDRETPLLKELKYGSPEYLESVQRLGDVLKHHYANNSHHPQHRENGINGMNLFDVIEMFFDWKAAGERTKGGNIYTSIEINSERYDMSKQLKEIFINTAYYMGYGRP